MSIDVDVCVLKAANGGKTPTDIAHPSAHGPHGHRPDFFNRLLNTFIFLLNNTPAPIILLQFFLHYLVLFQQLLLVLAPDCGLEIN